MSDILETVLLLALPASGKSEVRRYLNHVSPQQRVDDFRMGPTVQLDDFPYVHVMRLIDTALTKLDKPRRFFEADDRSFIDGRDWGTLIQLLDEDYDDLVNKRTTAPTSAAAQLLARIDAASEKVDIEPRIATLDAGSQDAIAAALEAEARAMLVGKHAGYPDTLEGKTLVIEFARGGPQGSSMPLPAPYGYRYSLAQLSEAILEKASLLYIWVTPEESRRKNEARADPDDPGSILHHGVPHAVMVGEYGCDDMDWLEANASKPGTVPVDTRGKHFDLPVGRFDNRVDKTSFIRKDRADWTGSEVEAVHAGLKSAMDQLAGD